MNNNKFEEILEKIKNSNSILMTLHAGPDGDSLGSCCAMKYVLVRHFNKNVKIVSYDELASNMNDFSYVSDIEFGKDISDVDYKDFDLIIFLDCGDTSYISGKLKQKFQIPDIFTINIDHHPTNTYFSKLNYVDYKKASTCSVLIDFFKQMNIDIDQELANRLLLGVATDSGFLSYENSEQAISDVNFLISKGANYLNILKKVLYNQSLDLKKLVSLLIKNLKVNEKLKTGYSIISNKELNKLNINYAEARLAINDLQFIGGFDLVFNLIEFDDHIKGSLRSKRGVDVSLIAKELGGGGHKEAAAFRLDKMPLNDAKKMVFRAIKNTI